MVSDGNAARNTPATARSDQQDRKPQIRACHRCTTRIVIDEKELEQAEEGKECAERQAGSAQGSSAHGALLMAVQVRPAMCGMFDLSERFARSGWDGKHDVVVLLRFGTLRTAPIVVETGLFVGVHFCGSGSAAGLSACRTEARRGSGRGRRPGGVAGRPGLGRRRGRAAAGRADERTGRRRPPRRRRRAHGRCGAPRAPQARRLAGRTGPAGRGCSSWRGTRRVAVRPQQRPRAACRSCDRRRGEVAL